MKLGMRRYEGDIEKLGAPSGTKLGAWNRQEVGDFITILFCILKKEAKMKQNQIS